MNRLIDLTGAVIAGALAATACAGCGGSQMGGGTPGPIVMASGPYQPLAAGASWTYHVNDQGVTYDKLSTVDGMETLSAPKDGVMAWKVRETIKSSVQLTWYEVTATDVRRHHDQLTDTSGNVTSDEWYDPYLLRVDETPEHLQAGASWSIAYARTKTTPTGMMTTSHTEAWHVDAVDTVVTVPAGTFSTLQLTRTDTADNSTKTQWFARGIGKVKEQTGGGHTEELASYQVASQ